MIKQDKISILKKITNFFRRIFGSRDVLLIDVSKENNVLSNNTINEFKRENDILQMQNQYEQGRIREVELTGNEKENLLNLYKKQIETLEFNIRMKKEELNNYKVKIIDKKQKFDSISNL